MVEDLRRTNLLLLALMRQSRRDDAGKKIESWLGEVRCSGCYETVEKGDTLYHDNFCKSCVEKADMMEKRGVCAGEGTPPAVKEAEAKKCPDCGHAPGERGQSGGEKKASCGSDLASKMADAASDKKA